MWKSVDPNHKLTNVKVLYMYKRVYLFEFSTLFVIRKSKTQFRLDFVRIITRDETEIPDTKYSHSIIPHLSAIYHTLQMYDQDVPHWNRKWDKL